MLNCNQDSLSGVKFRLLVDQLFYYMIVAVDRPVVACVTGGL